MFNFFLIDVIFLFKEKVHSYQWIAVIILRKLCCCGSFDEMSAEVRPLNIQPWRLVAYQLPKSQGVRIWAYSKQNKCMNILYILSTKIVQYNMWSTTSSNVTSNYILQTSSDMWCKIKGQTVTLILALRVNINISLCSRTSYDSLNILVI